MCWFICIDLMCLRLPNTSVDIITSNLCSNLPYYVDVITICFIVYRKSVHISQTNKRGPQETLQKRAETGILKIKSQALLLWSCVFSVAQEWNPAVKFRILYASFCFEFQTLLRWRACSILRVRTQVQTSATIDVGLCVSRDSRNNCRAVSDHSRRSVTTGIGAWVRVQ